MALEPGSWLALLVAGMTGVAGGWLAGRRTGAARSVDAGRAHGSPDAPAPADIALEASGALVAVWPPDDPATPGDFGAPHIAGPDGLLTQLGGADACLAALAQNIPGLQAATATLRSRGTAFELEAGGWRATGVPVGGQVVLWARPVRPGESLAALQTTPAAVWQLDRTGQLVWANAAYLKAVEAPTLEAACAASASIDAQAAADGQAAAAGTGSTRTRTVTVAGQRRVWRILHAPLTDGATGLAFDITEEAEGYDSARREVAAHVETLNILTDAVALFDARRRLRVANSAFASLWGIDPAILDERPTLSEVIDILRARDLLPHEKDITGWKERQLAAYAEAGPLPDEMWPLPGGQILRVAKKRLPDGGLLILFDDITGTAALQARYKTQLEVQNATLDKLAEAVGVFSGDGALAFANVAFARIWGLEPEFVAARPGFDSLVDRVRHLYREDAFWSGLKARLTDPSPAARQETQGEITRRDRTILTWLTRPLPDGATLVAFADVTAARKVEQAALERAAAFQEADQLKTDFVRNISYQLRTPLNTITGYADMLTQGVAGELSGTQQNFLGAIQSAGTALADMIESILDLAMIDAGQLTLDLGDVDVRTLLEETAELARSKAADSQVLIDVDCDPQIGLIRADGKRIRQVLFSLAGIALRTTGPGDRITIGARGLDGCIRLWVEDTGQILDDQERASAFKMFDDRTRRGGISLALVRRFIEMHGGWTSVSVSPGRGNLVACRLPLIATRRHAAPELELAS